MTPSPLTARPRAEEILRNDVPLSLRLSGVLLLGAVNVYVIKLDMLQKDSHRALETLEQVCPTSPLGSTVHLS